MKHLILSTLLAVVALSASAFNKIYRLDGQFSAINASGNVEIDYTVGAKPSLTAKFKKQSDAALLEVHIAKGTLTITTKDPDNLLKDEVKITLTAPACNKITIDGNAEINVLSPMQFTAMEVTSSGNSQVDFNSTLNVDGLKANSSGNSEIDFDGAVTCKTLAATASGNSEMGFDKLVADHVDVGVAGNATLKMTGKAVTADLRSSGNSSLKATKLGAKTGTALASGNSTLKCAVKKLTSRTVTGNASFRNIAE